MKWKFWSGCNAAIWLVTSGALALPVNELKVPQSLADIEAIEARVQELLPRLSAATVCIDLGEGTGSGVIVSSDGLVLTAAHVIMGVQRKATVVLHDGTRLRAETLGLMADTDAAMLQILEGGPFGFVEVAAPEQRAQLGDWLISLGHAGGFDKARGPVLRVSRLVRIAHHTLQSDGTLIGGDSGGPLFDLEGRVVGIHSRVGPNLPVNMHVPIALFHEYWQQLRSGTFIGEGPFAQAPRPGSALLGIATEAHEQGLRITKVGKNTPAAKAELAVGDIILSVDGQKFLERSALQNYLKTKSQGQRLQLQIAANDEKPRDITLYLAPR